MKRAKHRSGWTVDTLKEYLDEKIAAAATLQDSKWLAQSAHNVAANEWRDTIGDLKRDFVPRTEHQALEARYAADQLAIARTLAQTGGERQGAKDTKETSMATLSLIVAAVGGMSGVLGAVLATIMRPMGHG